MIQLNLDENETQQLITIINEAPIPRRITDVIMLKLEDAINLYHKEKQKDISELAVGPTATAAAPEVRSDNGASQHSDRSTKRHKGPKSEK